jgi:hypothetical protein
MPAVVARVRSFFIRGLAVVAVVATYALGSVGSHVLSVTGVSSLLSTAGVSVCVPKIRFCSIDDEGRRGQAVM